jgi:hypothetical protein
LQEKQSEEPGSPNVLSVFQKEQASKGEEVIEFKSDKVSIRGPKQDNSYVVTFEVGEYQRQNVQALLGLEPEQVLKVTVETE